MTKRSLTLLTILLPAGSACRRGGPAFPRRCGRHQRGGGQRADAAGLPKPEGAQIASGSGFVAFDERTLITSYHVVAGGDLVLAESTRARASF